MADRHLPMLFSPGSPAINAGKVLSPRSRDDAAANPGSAGPEPNGWRERPQQSILEPTRLPFAVTGNGKRTDIDLRWPGHQRTGSRSTTGKAMFSIHRPILLDITGLVNLIPGTTYILTVTHKLYLFTSPQFFTADQNRDESQFITGILNVNRCCWFNLNGLGGRLSEYKVLQLAKPS